MAGVRFAEWGFFGFVYGAILFGIIGLIATIFTGQILVLPFFIILGAIAGAIGYVMIGVIYDLFLKRFFSKFGLFEQVLGTTLVISLTSALLLQLPINLFVQVIGAVIGAAILVVVVGLFKLKTPFGGK